MPSTFFGLTIGTSGLYASQAGLNTTAHNIANTETEGYTRQVAKQQAGNAMRVNAKYGMAGTGVDITGVEQIRDSYYDVKYRTNNTMYGSYSTKQYYMSTIENYFNEVKLEGFTKNFDSMYNSIQELSKNPTDLTVRTQVTNFAQSTTDYVNELASNLESVQEECNYEIKNQVDRINSLSQQIATITKQINTLEVGGGTANDLRDQRNIMVEELSGYANISVNERVVGSGVGITSYTVTMDSQTLVDTYTANQLKVVPRTEKVNVNDVDGLYDICWQSGQKLNTQSPTLGGTLRALFEVRDGNNGENFKGKVTAAAGDLTVKITDTNINDVEHLNLPSNGVLTIGNREYHYNGFAVTQNEDTGAFEYEFTLDDAVVVDVDNESVRVGEDIAYKGVPYYMAQLNQFVRTYAKAFNEVHTSGVDLNGEKGLDFFNGKDVVSGKNFVLSSSPTDEANGYLFTTRTGAFAQDYVDEDVNYGSYYMLNSKNFCITDAVYTDAKKLATSRDITNGSGNNDNVEKLLALKDDVSMFKQGKPAQFFQTLVAEIGIDTKKTSNFAENQSNILSAVENQRLSISGVDSEEEAMNLVRYQNAYGLSAKVISVMDEIFDKLINYMGA
jgi:flagellar hook-associated protein 1 FlgK